MKRLIATTALVATLASGAYAATEGQLSMLQNYLPGVDVTMLTEQQVDDLLVIAAAESDDTERAAKLQAYLTPDNAIVADPLNEAELNAIYNAVPDADVSLLTNGEIVEIRGAIVSGDEQEIKRVFETLSANKGMLDAVQFTAAEEAEIINIQPNADFSKIDAQESRQIRAALTGGDRKQIETVIRAALAS
ncbi:hypothetical protein [Tropicibacter sp. S64]|uniref:hypothetical protein n=1 Tax=Tropicibacter sp. S64 TaxID=3415122 RepID=UPI003C7BE3FC